MAARSLSGRLRVRCAQVPLALAVAPRRRHPGAASSRAGGGTAVFPAANLVFDGWSPGPAESRLKAVGPPQAVTPTPGGPV